jgi:hypothetical protein
VEFAGYSNFVAYLGNYTDIPRGVLCQTTQTFVKFSLQIVSDRRQPLTPVGDFLLQIHKQPSFSIDPFSRDRKLV